MRARIQNRKVKSLGKQMTKTQNFNRHFYRNFFWGVGIFFLFLFSVSAQERSLQEELAIKKNNTVTEENTTQTNASEQDSETLQKTSSESISHEGVITPQYLLIRGLSLFNEQQWSQAKKHFQIYIGKFGDNEVANRYLAQIFIIEGNLKKAEEYLLRGLKTAPTSTETLLLLGSIAENQSKPDAAISYYEDILEIDPYNEEAIFALSQLYLRYKKDEYHAMGFYKRLVAALQHNGGSAYQLMQIYNALGRYYTEKSDYPRAIGYFLQIEKFNARNIANLFAIGQLYKLSGDLQKSIEYMQKIQKLDFRNEASLFSLAESYYMTRSWEAKAYVEAYLRRAGKAPEKLIMAMDDELANKDKEALAKFSTMKELAARVGKAKIFAKENDSKNLKIEAYRVVLMSNRIQAYALAREFSQIVFSLLEKEKDQQNFYKLFFQGEGQDLNMPVIKSAIDSIELYSLYAQILRNLDEPRAAIAYYRQSYDYAERLQTVLHNSPDFLKEEKNLDIQKSLDLLDEKKYHNMANMALLYGIVKEYSQSYSAFQNAAAMYPKLSRIYFLYGLTVHKEANEKKSDPLYRQAYSLMNKAILLAQKEGDVPAAYYFERGVLGEKKIGFAKAEPDLKKAVELDGNNPTYLNYLGYMYSQNNRDLQKARSLLMRALDDDLENHAYLDSLGWIFFKQGEYAHALRNLLMAESYAEKNNIKDAVLYFHLGETYYKLKDFALANSNYKRALQFSADSSEELDVQYIKNMIKKTSEQTK